jgi:hypothetical protein
MCPGREPGTSSGLCLMTPADMWFGPAALELPIVRPGDDRTCGYLSHSRQPIKV